MNQYLWNFSEDMEERTKKKMQREEKSMNV